MKANKKLLALLLILIPVLLILIFSMSGNNTSARNMIKSGKEVTFFVASDTHYLAEKLTDGGSAFQEAVNSDDGKELNYIHEIMDAFSYDIKKKKPDVLIISGDLTCNGERESHLELAKRLKEIEKSGTSVYVIPGNHDIFNPYARGFKGAERYSTPYISDKDFSKIYGDFGYNEAVSRDKTTLSYLAAPTEDVWLLMLDTAQYKNNITNGVPQLDGVIAPETMNWIKQCSDLAKSKGARIIAVMHHNLMNHSETVNKGFTINNSRDIIQLFQQCGIELSLSGHIHLQDIKSYRSEGEPIYDIASGCISIYPQKYGVLKYSPEYGISYNTDNVNVEGWSREIGIIDDNLNNFTEYSRSFYGNRIYSKIVSKLAFDDICSSEEIKLMGDTYKMLYLRYYEGVREIADEDMRNSPGFRLWINYESGPSKQNVLRLANINGEENNKLQIPNAKTLK